jgi:hypothetical protein
MFILILFILSNIINIDLSSSKNSKYLSKQQKSILCQIIEKRKYQQTIECKNKNCKPLIIYESKKCK